MKIKEYEVKSVVSNHHNYELAKTYDQINSIIEMEIQHSDDHYYEAVATLDTDGYVHHAMVKLNEQGRVMQYGCDCKYCDAISGCAHVGALLLKIMDCKPKTFPFTYEHLDVGAVDFDPSDPYHNELLQLKKRSIELREQRRKDYEDYLREQENKQLNMRKNRSHDYIAFEKEKLFSLIKPIETHEYQVEIHDVKLNQSFYSNEKEVAVTLKVGKRKKYVVKNISDLFERIENNEHFRYGKDLAFTHSYEAFDEQSQTLLRLLEATMQSNTQMNFYSDQKDVLLSYENLDKFFDYIYENKEFAPSLTIRSQKMVIQIEVEEKQHAYEIRLLSPRRNGKFIYGKCHLYEVKKGDLLRRELDAYGKTIRLYDNLLKDPILIDKDDIYDFYRYILMDCMPCLKVKQKHLLPEVKEETSIQLYADVDENGMIRIDLDCFIDENKIKGFSDSKQKPPHLEMLEHHIASFANVVDYDKCCAYVDSEAESTFSFLKDGFQYLSEYCEIYVSDALQQMTRPHSINFQVGVRVESDLLCVDFESDDMHRDEIFEVLRAYRRKRKYHRLKDGRLLYLECNELHEMDHLLDDLGLQPQDIKHASVKMPLYRSFYLQEQMENREASLDYHRKQTFDDFMSNFDSEKAKHKAELPTHYESILRDYQKDGFQWMKLLNLYQLHGILADDMGLGKTLQVLALIESEKGDGKTSIIIAPSSLLLNWKDEVEKFSAQLKCTCILGNAAQRSMLINDVNAYDMVITSYDYIRRDVTLYDKVNFHYIILDEAQYIKNQKTKNAVCVKMLKGKHRLALTGTPIENSLAELWSIFDFLLPGYLYHYHYFQNHYEKQIVNGHDEETQKKLKMLVEPFILRRTKKQVLTELPDKIETTLTLSFEEEERKIYLANLSQASKDLAEKLNMDKPDRMAILAMLTKLRQICCEPRLLFDNITTPGSKLKGCIELIQNLKENKQRVLLFSSFTSMLDLIAEELTKNHIHYFMLTGKTDKEERRNLVNRFQSGISDVFLISLKAGGTGLNLTGAQAVIHYDPWWNESAQNQASDRAYRIGQTENVTVYKLIMEDSIEKKIQDLQMKKKNLADTFVEGNEGSIQSMQLDDIVELFHM